MGDVNEIDELIAQAGTLESAWTQVVDTYRQRSPEPEEWRQAWERVRSHWDESIRGPFPMWTPSAEDREASNLTRFMNAKGHASYDALYQWSLEDTDGYWLAVARALEIQFDVAPSAGVDLSGGVMQPKWYPGAALNIVESCFPTGATESDALVWGGPDGELKRKSYGELRREVENVAASLRASGFEPGDRVAIVMPMTPESVSIYLGIVFAGLVAVSIADSFAAPEIAKRISIANATGVFCVDSFERAGRTIRIFERIIEAGAARAIVLDLDPGTSLRSGDLAWSDFLALDDGSVDRRPRRSPPEGHITVLFSSGTTGDPKAIPWTQVAPIKAAADGYFHHDIHAGDVVVWPTNLGWMMGPWLIFASLINRATIGLYDDAPDGPGFGRFVERARATIFGVVPTMVRSWRASKCMEAFDWSAVRCFSSTGEASNADDMFYLSSLAGMKPIIEYCGGTEVGGGYIASSVHHANAPAKFSTPVLGNGIVILDQDGVEADEGELFLIPPAVGMSTELLNRDHDATYYAGAPKGRNGEILRRHGDHFVRLPGGFYAAGGRVDDTMNLGGIKISSAEIERELNRMDGVAETAAVAIPAAGGGPDTLAVFVVVAEGESPSPEVLRGAMDVILKKKLNPLFRIDAVRLVDELPRTASNKVMRRKLRERL